MARFKKDQDDQIEQRTVLTADERTEQIAHAAVTLFSERGYYQTTIEDISNHIGVGKGLIYRYFKDKQDVLFHALCTVLEKYRKADVGDLIVEVGPLAAMRKVLAVNCMLAQQHAQEIVLAYRSTKDLSQEQRRQIKAIESEIVGDIRRGLEACIREGLMESIDVRVMAYQYLMFGHTWALKNWALSRHFKTAGFIAQGERLLIVPFLTAAGRKVYESKSERARAKNAGATGAQ